MAWVRNIELVGTGAGRPKVDYVLCLEAFWVRITSMHGKAIFGTAYGTILKKSNFAKRLVAVSQSV